MENIIYFRMDRRNMPTASTPGNLKKGSEEETVTATSVPSPVLDSELTESNESTILDSSGMEDCSTTVQYHQSMEDTTLQEFTTSQTPVSARTRSHDETPTSMTTFRLGALEEQLKKELEYAEKQEDQTEYSIIDNDITIIEGNPLEDSQYQKGYKTEIKEVKHLYTNVANLNRSQRTLKEVEGR